MNLSNFPLTEKRKIDGLLQAHIGQAKSDAHTAIMNYREKREREKPRNRAIIIWVICLLLTGPLGIFIAYKLTRRKKCYDIDKDKKFRRFKEQEIARANGLIAHYQRQAEAEYNAYQKAFEDRSRTMAGDMAQSALALRLVELMTERFKNDIAAADRRAHVHTVEVPFSFSVYEDSVRYDGVNFDFTIERCAKLPDPLTQTALARVLQSHLDMQIRLAFPTDTTGTEVDLASDFRYSDDSAEVTLRYTAKNGNYQAAQSW